MSSSGTPTPNYNLNQWQASDKPERMDFNSDNQKIDAALLNKAKGNPATGDALNAEKLGGALAATYPQIEVGKWTPYIAGSDTAGSATYEVQEGNYVRIGNMAILRCALHMSTITGMTGSLHLKGSPFSFLSGSGPIGSVDGFLALPDAAIPTHWYISTGSNVFRMCASKNASRIFELDIAHIKNNFQVWGFTFIGIIV